MGCGSVIEPVVEIGSDIAAAATGNAEFIPAINAAETTVGGVAQGESLGKAAGQGAIAGGESLAGQELAGAVGIGEGNTAFNGALGITGDNPAGTGLPDIGGAFNSAIGATGPSAGAAIDSATGLPVSQEATNTAGATINSVTGQTVAAPATSVSATPSSGGGFAGAASAPDLSAGQLDTQLYPDSVSSSASTTASPNLGSVGSSPVGATSAIGAQSPDAIGSLAPSTTGTSNITSSNAANVGTGAGGGTSSLLSKAENVGIQAALPLTALAYEAIKGPAALPSQSAAIGPNGSVTGPLQQLETQGATEATTGQLTPTQQAGITQYVNNAQNQLIQQLASEGVTDPTHDSRYLQGMQQIQQNALVQQQQYITAAIAEATSAGGAASSNIAQVANQQIQQDTSYQDALASAFAALGGSLGGVVNNRPQA